LDGQQRTLTMLLGYCGRPRACLWLDLGQPGVRGRVFSLRLTTDSQPFGFDPNDPTRKLSAREKREAREKFIKEHTHYKGKFDHEFCLGDTRPWKALLPVPMVELWKAWREFEGNGHSDEWWKTVVTTSTSRESYGEACPQIINQLRSVVP
jgi:hypothetical protein